MTKKDNTLTRRGFLRGLAGSLILLPLGIREAAAATEAVTPWTPPIYKRFLNFTEYEERTGTEMIVIHHTGFPGEDKDATAMDIHKFHQETNGWAGIGYHYLIRKDGMVEQGRRPPMIGAHAYHFNQKSVGICLAGNFDIGKPTEEQMEAVTEMVAWLCMKYRLDPMKKGVVVGHRDLNDTSCPGKNLYRHLDEIRRGAAAMNRN